MNVTTSRGAVDRLARIRARMKDLESQEAELIELLRKSNHATIAGRRYIATLTRAQREVLDAERVRALLAERTPTRTVSTFSVRTAPRAG
jgi:hypothetical protein